jgi:hypothetical protein
MKVGFLTTADVQTLMTAANAAKLVVAAPQSGQQPNQLVSLDDAKALVRAALPSKTKQLPKFEIEGGDDPTYPHFYVFQALWAGTPNGSVVVGIYAVDKETVDVWNAPAACVEMSTPALHELQAKVRSRMGLSRDEYRKKKRRCPLEVEGNGPL